MKIGAYRHFSQSRTILLDWPFRLAIKITHPSKHAREVRGYNSVCRHLPVPRLYTSINFRFRGLAVFERVDTADGQNVLLAQALRSGDLKQSRQGAKELGELYVRLLDETGAWSSPRVIEQKLFADRCVPGGRLDQWYPPEVYDDLILISPTSTQATRFLDLRNWLQGLALGFEPVLSTISQGDPTEFNLVTPLRLFDFETGGRNAVLGDIANFCWSILGQGGYFVPRYNPMACEFLEGNLSTGESGEISVDIERLESGQIVVCYVGEFVKARSEVVSIFLSKIESVVKLKYDGVGYDFDQSLGRYIAARILLTIDPRVMKTADRMYLIAKASEAYQLGGTKFLWRMITADK